MPYVYYACAAKHARYTRATNRSSPTLNADCKGMADEFTDLAVQKKIPCLEYYDTDVV
jgi:hypothetical protein